MSAFAFTSCVPFSNNTPLTGGEPERTGVLFRAAGHEAPPPVLLLELERILGLDGSYSLRYADKKKGQHRTIRLARHGDQAELTGFVLAGDTSAENWIATLLKEELPAQAYGRLLLLPGAKPPVAVQSRGKTVCSCFNVSDIAIDAHLSRFSQGADAAASTDEARLASLQGELKCGTNCGSCIPELKRRVRCTQGEAAGQTAPARSIIPIKLQA